MSRYTRLHAETTGGHVIRIAGRPLNIHFARIVYRCGECFGELRKKNAGLVCKTDPSHRGFIHRDDARAKMVEQEEKLNQIEAVYEVVDGQIVAKEK